MLREWSGYTSVITESGRMGREISVPTFPSGLPWLGQRVELYSSMWCQLLVPRSGLPPCHGECTCDISSNGRPGRLNEGGRRKAGSRLGRIVITKTLWKTWGRDQLLIPLLFTVSRVMEPGVYPEMLFSVI